MFEISWETNKIPFAKSPLVSINIQTNKNIGTIISVALRIFIVPLAPAPLVMSQRISLKVYFTESHYLFKRAANTSILSVPIKSAPSSICSCHEFSLSGASQKRIVLPE
jgi:hypothetical protein